MPELSQEQQEQQKKRNIIAKDGSKRGLYNREVVFCPFCNLKIRGKQALAKHINSKHSIQQLDLQTHMAEVAKESTTLIGMLQKVCDWLNNSNGPPLPDCFKEELQKQDVKAHVALRIAAFGKIKAVLEQTNLITNLTNMIIKKAGNNELQEMSLRDLLNIKTQLEKSLTGDMDFLLNLIGLGKSEQFYMDKLLSAISGNVGTEYMRMSDSISVLPEDSREREEIRKQTMRYVSEQRSKAG